ncbi:MAG: phosphoheptose isomerase [Saprospirales bacterium]|nr:phosphoheptose isomerase [Saprospirales bacterium]|tara:strand:- start:41 stop:649 length:609 start_codon:yes stop_codon:yes gene_type:complete
MEGYKERLEALIQSKESLYRDLLSQENADVFESAKDLLVQGLLNGQRVFFCGNGGSFAQAQHLASELSGRFYMDRPPLAAICLGSSGSMFSAVSNDFGYEEAFAREIQALAQPMDILVVLTTSGSSPNILRAVKMAGDFGMQTLALTSKRALDLLRVAEVTYAVDSEDVARIQEMHLFFGHLLCAQVEAEIFAEPLEDVEDE